MRFYITLFCLFAFVKAGAQIQVDAGYPKDYFRNPLDIPILLAGNFGECRPNHFHTGIDLKTDSKENMNVYAAADGYVSRVSISHSGYGNAIYIAHPNGYTTLYGHLNDFYPALQQYVVQQQYAQESWNMDMQIAAGQFPVKKGQFIAFSGTTGGSTGPHLHFEIRDSKTLHVLNAALFGLPIKDDIAPVAKSIALYNESSVYEQSPILLPLKKTGNQYAIATKVYSFNGEQLRVGVLADDFMNGSTNSLGVYEMKLFMDNELQVSWRLNDIDFDQNRYVNAFADYKLKEENKGWYQTLFRTPGNKLNAYTYINAKDGLLDLSDRQPHEIKVELKDAAGNTANIDFTVLSIGKSPLAKGCSALWTAGQRNELNTPNVSFVTDKNALYDAICFRYTETASGKNYSPILQLMDTKIPLQGYSELGIKLNKLVPFDLRSKLVFIHHIKAASLPGNNPQDAVAAAFDKGMARAAVRTFGNYYVAVDTVAPVIKSLQKGTDWSKLGSIRFTVNDKITSVKTFRAELDGQWLRLVRSGTTYTYTFDGRCARGKHQLVITATDENENKSVQKFSFNR